MVSISKIARVSWLLGEFGSILTGGSIGLQSTGGQISRY